MDTELSILFLSMMILGDWKLIARNGPRLRPNNLLYFTASNDDASVSSVAESGGLVTNTRSCGLNAKVSRTRRS